MTAVACVAGLGLSLIAAMAHAWWMSRLYRRRARLERAADLTGRFDPRSAMEPGPVTLSGRIQGEPVASGGSVPARGPLTVSIEQTGVEVVRGGWIGHRWDEAARTVEARPFRLLLEGGQSVRVEPGQDVVLVAPDECHQPLDARRRRRTATIAAGTAVQVRGHLRSGIDPASAGSSGYRDPGRRLVLAGAEGEPLVCSTQPLGARLQAQADWYQSAAVLFALLLGLTQLGIYGRFHLLGAFGKQITGTEVQTFVRRASPRSRFVEVGGRATFVDAGARHRLSDRVQFDEVPRPRSTRTYTVLPAMPAVHQMGDRPRISLHLFFWVSLLCGSLIIGHFRRVGRERRERPWYQQGPLVEEGTGPLPLLVTVDPTERA